MEQRVLEYLKGLFDDLEEALKPIVDLEVDDEVVFKSIQKRYETLKLERELFKSNINEWNRKLQEKRDE